MGCCVSITTAYDRVRSYQTLSTDEYPYTDSQIYAYIDHGYDLDRIWLNGRALLHNVHTAMLNLLINAKADVNVRTLTGGRSVVLQRMLEKQLTLSELRTLLAAKADINVADVDGETPLRTAIAQNKPDLVACLVENKADCNVGNMLLYAYSSRSSLIYEKIVSSSRANPWSVWKWAGLRLCDFEWSLVHDERYICFHGSMNEVSHWKNAQLALACRRTLMRLCLTQSTRNLFRLATTRPLFNQSLVERIFGYADLLYKPDRSYLPLIRKAFLRDEMMEHVVRERKVNLHINRVPLIFYASKDSEDVLLWAGADITRRSADGSTLLHARCIPFSLWDYSAIQSLASRLGAEIVNAYNASGYTALHLQANTGGSHMITRALIHEKADVNQVTRNDIKMTALEIAIRSGRVDRVILELLLVFECDPFLLPIQNVRTLELKPLTAPSHRFGTETKPSTEVLPPLINACNRRRVVCLMHVWKRIISRHRAMLLLYDSSVVSLTLLRYCGIETFPSWSSLTPLQ